MGQATSGGGSFAPAFGGFMNDQTAQMGFQVGKSAVMAGQEYMEQNVSMQTTSPLSGASASVLNQLSCRSTATSPSAP